MCVCVCVCVCVWLIFQVLYLCVYTPSYFWQSPLGFPGGSVVKNPPANERDAGDTGSIPGSGRSPGKGQGNPLQYSCLGNPMLRRAWWATLLEVAKEVDMIKWLNTNDLGPLKSLDMFWEMETILGVLLYGHVVSDESFNLSKIQFLQQ